MAKKSTIYFVNESHVEAKESLPIRTYESSREFDKATSKEGGVFWGVKSANESSRFSDWGSLNSVDTDEETAKRVKHATKLLVAFTTYVETVATLNEIRASLEQHPDNEELKKSESEIEKRIAAAEKNSDWSVLDYLPGLLSGFKDGAETLKTLRDVLGYNKPKN